MKVEFKGTFTDERKVVLETATKFFGECLFSNDFIDDIYIEITNLEKEIMGQHNEKGNCEVLDSFERNPTMFLLEIGNEEQLETLAHEMIHAEQYNSRKLRDGKNINDYIWKRKKIDTTNLDYYDYPWEIDAYGREVGLIYKFYSKYPQYKTL